MLEDLVALVEAKRVDDSVRTGTARCLVDGLATIFLGLHSPVITGLLPGISEVSRNAGVTLIRSRFRVQAADAALIHGAAAHVFDIGDGFADAGLHPGEVLVPVALAVSERERCGAADLARGLSRSYEIANRIGRALHPELTARYICPTGPVGAMAAAYLAADLMDLPIDLKLGAMGTALLIAPISTFEWAATRPLHAGAAAAAGVRAADLARQGVTGAVDGLAGSRGISALVGAQRELLTKRALAELDPAVCRVYFKPYAACRHSHGAIDAGIYLRNEIGAASADAIRGIHITTYPLAAQLVNRFTGIESDWSDCDTSIQYATAVALLTGDCGPDAMARKGRGSTVVHELAHVVTVSPSDDLGMVYPTQAPTRVAVALRDGGVRMWEVKHRRGDPECPMSSNELGDRCIKWAVRAGASQSDAAEVVKHGFAAVENDTSLHALLLLLGEFSTNAAERNPEDFP